MFRQGPTVRNRRRPAGNAAEQTRAQPAQLLMTDQVGFPARSWPFLLEVLRQRSESRARVHFVDEPWKSCRVDSRETCCRSQQFLAIEPYFRQCRQAVEAQWAGAVGMRKGRAVPPITGVEIVSGTEVPLSGTRKRLRNRAGNNGRQPILHRSKLVRVRDHARRLRSMSRPGRPWACRRPGLA